MQCCCVPILLTMFPPESQRNISIATERGVVRLSKCKVQRLDPELLWSVIKHLNFFFFFFFSWLGKSQGICDWSGKFGKDPS